MALREVGAVGLGGEPSAGHRLDLWIPVISVELDHPVVGGDTGEPGERRNRHVKAADALPAI
jgi:hypothetical protein